MTIVRHRNKSRGELTILFWKLWVEFHLTLRNTVFAEWGVGSLWVKMVKIIFKILYKLTKVFVQIWEVHFGRSRLFVCRFDFCHFRTSRSYAFFEALNSSFKDFSSERLHKFSKLHIYIFKNIWHRLVSKNLVNDTFAASTQICFQNSLRKHLCSYLLKHNLLIFRINFHTISSQYIFKSIIQSVFFNSIKNDCRWCRKNTHSKCLLRNFSKQRKVNVSPF